jgi:hypothetical protein
VIIELTQGKQAVIDDDDYNLVKDYTWTWDRSYPHSNGYAKTYIRVGTGRINGVRRPRAQLRMHSLIAAAMGIKGEADHKDCDGLNNRRSNLRPATRIQQMMNTRKRLGCYSSQYKGVQWNPQRQRWVANLKYRGRLYRLGSFKSEVEAAEKYDDWAETLFGDYARLNLPISAG